MNAITIHDAQGNQVFGLDSATQLHLYKRGDRVFQLPGGLSLRILCDLPTAADAGNQESGYHLSASLRGGETTSPHIDIYADG